MTPAYGLAEAGVAVTFPPLGRGPAIDAIDRAALARRGRAVPATAGDRAVASDVLQAASCGRPLPGYQVRVVDTAGGELGERREGRIEFTGPSATPGTSATRPPPGPCGAGPGWTLVTSATWPAVSCT